MVFAPYRAEREERYCFNLGLSATTKNNPLRRETIASEPDTLLKSGRMIYVNRATKPVVKAIHPAIGASFFIFSSPSIGI